MQNPRSTDEIRHLEVFRREILWNEEKRFQVLYHDITELQKAEEQTKHLESLLKAIRNINQLITREHDRQQLVKGCCEILRGVREHSTVWISLIDSEGKIYFTVESGLGMEFTALKERMAKGNLPTCARLALGQRDAIFLSARENQECQDCPLGKHHSGQGRIAVRLSYEGKTYGLMTIAGNERFLNSTEGLGLVQEVTGDIAFALFRIELEEQNRLISKALQETEAKYHDLYENAPIPYYSVDMDGIIRECNQAGTLWLGYEPGELIGKNCLQLFAEDSRDKAGRLFEEYKRGKAVEP